MVNRLSSHKNYGWVIVAVCAILLFVAFGVRLSFTVFFVALVDEFGWSRGQTSTIFSTTMVVFLFTSTFVGMTLDRFGVRVVFSLGALLMAGGLYLSSQITSFGQLVLTYGVLVGVSITMLGLSIQSAVISNWFQRENKGLAIGLAFAGTGLGSLVMTPSVTWVIANHGWRRGLQGLSVLAVATVPLVLLFLRTRPNDSIETISSSVSIKDGGWTFRDALQTSSFWLLLLAGLTTMAPIRLLTVHQLAMMRDAGVDVGQGSIAVGLAGAVVAVTFILSGWVSDRLGRPVTYALGALCVVVALGVMAFLETAGWLIWAYALFLGMGEGSRSSLVMATATDLFPGKAVGAISGAVGAAFGGGAALYPWMAGRIFDVTGSYGIALWVGGVTALVSATSLWLAQRNRLKVKFDF